jgi:tight adherence protein B
MEPLLLAISVLVMFTVASLVLGLRRVNAGASRMASRLEVLKGEVASKSAETVVGGAFKQARSYSGFPILSGFIGRLKGSEAAALMLERAGIPLRVGEYYMIRWGVAVAFFLVPLIFGFSMINLFFSLGLAFVGYMVPAMWVSNKHKKRTIRIEGQLVDMLGMVANSLKSGYGLMQSFEFAARQMHAPLALELRRMLREANLGMSAEEALNSLGKRIDSKDLDMVLTAINIQRTVGGNLAEILEKVAFTMRERERIRGEISTLTAQQKMTGIVIGGLPLFMFAIFMVINPEYMSLLFTTFAGRAIIVMATVLEVMGYFSIKKIMAIEV